MSPPDPRFDALEQLVARTLRAQPPLRAPPTLEREVLAEIARRTAHPWWRRSFPRWPLAARCAFVVACALAMTATVGATAWLSGNLRRPTFDGLLAGPASLVQASAHLIDSMAAAGDSMFGSIPSFWLYSGAFAGVALYVTFFGLGAAAYRTLCK